MGIRTKSDSLEIRQKIVHQAIRIFALKGINGTSLEDIANASGVSRGAIYWHFNSKYEIYFAFRDEYLDRMVNDLLSTLSVCLSASTDAIFVIKSFLNALAEYVCQDNSMRLFFEVVYLRNEACDSLMQERILVESKLESFYKPLCEAYEIFTVLQGGINSTDLARDTCSFLHVLIYKGVLKPVGTVSQAAVSELIECHLKIRKALLINKSI